MRRLRLTVIGIALAGLAVSLSAQETSGDTVGTVTFQGVATPAWRIVEIEGDGVATQSGTNTLVLEIGGRYTFDLSEVDSEFFPMELRAGSGDVIASQRDVETGGGYEDADISVSDEQIQFTLTEELASRLTFYRAATYPSMVGVIRTYSREAAEQDEEQDGDTSDSDGSG